MSHPNLDGLLRLSQTRGVDIRPALLRVITDLYVQERSHSREEQRQYVELALQLLPAVDVSTRRTIARKLAAYPEAPAAVMAHLADDVAPSAAEAEPAPVAQEPTPQPAPRAAPPARTATMSLGERFLRADAAERLAMVADDEHGSGAAHPFRPVTTEVHQRLEEAAMARNLQAFARELQRSLGISPAAAERITRDDGGEPVLVALKALGMDPDVVVRVLLFLNPAIGESIRSVFTLVRLYHALSTTAADAIVASWRDEAMARAAAAFRPGLSDAGSAPASAREQASPRRSPAPQREGEPVRRNQGAS